MAYTTYTDTDEKTETSSFASSSRTGVLDNQMDFSSASTSYYQPSYSTLYTPTQEEEEEQSTTSFEVEKEYKMNEDLGGDVTIIPTFMPTIERKVKEKSLSSNVKLKLNARGKIIAAVFSVISVLLISFCIYNAVKIGQLSNALAEKQAQAEFVSREVYTATTDYNELTSKDNILASEYLSSYRDASNDVVEVELMARPTIASAQSSTNWFDKLCNFLSNLFN